jgi:hypothetical protein
VEELENKEKMQTEKEKTEKLTVKEFFQMNEVLGYFFRKKDPNRPSSFNLRMMHGINKISILMFLVCLIVILLRLLFR